MFNLFKRVEHRKQCLKFFKIFFCFYRDVFGVFTKINYVAQYYSNISQTAHNNLNLKKDLNST